MKTLYLHIGVAKTGSTAIQNFCRENAKLLKKQGYCYPKSPKSYQYKQPSAKNGDMLDPRIKDENGNRLREQEEADIQECIAMIKEKFEKFDTVIISDERIFRDLSKNCKKLLQNLVHEGEETGFVLKVVVYLRRQDLLVDSLWNQWIKSPYQRSTYTFQEFCENMKIDEWLDYEKKMDKIVKEVGRENVIVRRFEPQSFYGGDIYRDFLYAVDIPWSDDYVISKEVRNTRFTANALEIKRIINGIPGASEMEYQYFIRNALYKCSDTPGASTYPSAVFTEDEARSFLKKYEEGNRKVAREFFGEEELFDMTMKDGEKWDPNNAYMAEDVIRFVGVLGMELMKRQDKLMQELREEVGASKTNLKQKLEKSAKSKVKSIMKKIENL